MQVAAATGPGRPQAGAGFLWDSKTRPPGSPGLLLLGPLMFADEAAEDESALDPLLGSAPGVTPQECLNLEGLPSGRTRPAGR